MIFSAKKRGLNQQRALAYYHNHDFLLKHATEIIINQLNEFDCKFQHILEIDARFCHLTIPLRLLYPDAYYTAHQITNLHNLPQGVKQHLLQNIEELNLTNTYDLITSSCSLQWANDPIATLATLKNLLSDNGILIYSFLGGKSLSSFRTLLTRHESKLTSGVAQRISPMIRFEDCHAILQQAGFTEYVVNNEIITVHYSSYISLINDLRYMGESAAFDAPPHLLPRPVLPALKNIGKFKENFEIITITAGKNRQSFKNRLTLRM